MVRLEVAVHNILEYKKPSEKFIETKMSNAFITGMN